MGCEFWGVCGWKRMSRACVTHSGWPGGGGLSVGPSPVLVPVLSKGVRGRAAPLACSPHFYGRHMETVFVYCAGCWLCSGGRKPRIPCGPVSEAAHAAASCSAAP